MKHRIKIAAALAASGMAAAASPAFAISYASGVRNTGGAGWEFILNEGADEVKILRDGGNELTLTAPTAGRHTFDMTGFTNFEIKVAKNAAAGWAVVSDPANPFANFERPSDVIVNTNPASPYFGTVYVNNVRQNATAALRPMGDGVYAMTSDLIGVDLVTKAAIPLANVNDASLAKAPGWNNGDVGTTSGLTSAWRMTLDEAGNLIVGDFSDANGGVKYLTPDLTAGGSVLLHQDGIRPLLTNGSGQEVHGSIPSTPYVTGALGTNLTVYAIDEDMNPAAPSQNVAGPGNSLWKWNVGSTVGNYDGVPELIVNAGSVAKSSDNREIWMNTNVGVNSDAVFSPTHNKWYYIQNRSDGIQSGISVISPTTGGASTVEWSSLQFSIDNGFDGHATVAGNQDVFRQITGVTLSPDGTKLYVARNAQTSTANPVLGTTDVPGAIMIIPLDANGIPDLDVVAGKVVGIDSIVTASNTSNASTRNLTLDAAGNVYTSSSSSERLQVFSPGGNWLATTTSAGAFTLTEVGGGLDGDFNGDDVVDGADFLVWQQGGSPTPLSQADLTLWKTNYGQTAAAPAVGSVPEPATGVLALAAAFATSVMASRRRRS